MDYLTMDENVCPVCGKVFHTFVGREWGWTYKGSKYCSYHCMRHVEIRHRASMGWEKVPLAKGMDGLSPKEGAVAKELIKLRALRMAYASLSAAPTSDKAVAAVAERVRQLGEGLLSKWEDKFNQLDEGKKRIAYMLFVEGQSIDAVALAMDVDTDLMEIKLHLIYGALARGTV